MSEFKAIKNRVILEEVKEEEVTPAGIIIVQTEYSEEPAIKKYRVTSAGPNCEVIKDGDIVAVRPVLLKKREYMGKEFLMINELDIEGIYEQ